MVAKHPHLPFPVLTDAVSPDAGPSMAYRSALPGADPTGSDLRYGDCMNASPPRRSNRQKTRLRSSRRPPRHLARRPWYTPIGRRIVGLALRGGVRTSVLSGQTLNAERWMPTSMNTCSNSYGRKSRLCNGEQERLFDIRGSSPESESRAATGRILVNAGIR
jgi:hypothetical protein